MRLSVQDQIWGEQNETLFTPDLCKIQLRVDLGIHRIKITYGIFGVEEHRNMLQ